MEKYKVYIDGEFFADYKGTCLSDIAKQAYIDYDQDFQQLDCVIRVKNENKEQSFNCSSETVTQYNISLID